MLPVFRFIQSLLTSVQLVGQSSISVISLLSLGYKVVIIISDVADFRRKTVYQTFELSIIYLS